MKAILVTHRRINEKEIESIKEVIKGFNLIGFPSHLFRTLLVKEGSELSVSLADSSLLKVVLSSGDMGKISDAYNTDMEVEILVDGLVSGTINLQ